MAVGVLSLNVKSLPGQDFLVLVGGVQIEDEHAALLHKIGRLADGLFKIVQRADVAVRVKGGHRRADSAVQVQV